MCVLICVYNWIALKNKRANKFLNKLSMFYRVSVKRVVEVEWFNFAKYFYFYIKSNLICYQLIQFTSRVKIQNTTWKIHDYISVMFSLLLKHRAGAKPSFLSGSYPRSCLLFRGESLSRIRPVTHWLSHSVSHTL